MKKYAEYFWSDNHINYGALKYESKKKARKAIGEDIKTVKFGYDT